MRMGEQQGEAMNAGFFQQRLTQFMQPGAGIDHNSMPVVGLDFNARGMPTVAQRLRPGRRQ